MIVRNPRFYYSGDKLQCLALRGMARKKLSMLCDRIGSSEVGFSTLDFASGAFITCSKCYDQYSIYIHVPVSSPKVIQEIEENPSRNSFPIVVSNESGTSYFMWDGVYNKLMIPVQSNSSAMIAAMGAMGYSAFSEAVVTGTFAESWNYWETGVTPACPANSAYYDYNGGKDQGQYYCIAPYGGGYPYQLTNSYYVPRDHVVRTQVGVKYYNTWDYRYMTKPTSLPGTYADVGMQALSIKLFPYTADGTKAAEWTALTGLSWNSSSLAYWEYGNKLLQQTPRSLYFYHSIFDISLHTPVIAVIPETMPDASVSMLDTWRDVYAGGFVLNVGSWAEQEAGGGPWMNRAVGMDSTGGVIETDYSIIVYEAVVVIASLPVLWSWVSPSTGTYTVTDDGSIHNDADPVDGDDMTLLIGQILALTNQRRKEAGVPPLTINSKLTIAAHRHANDMALNDFLSHTGSDGSSASDRINDSGYFDSLYAGSGTKTAENIAVGYVTAEEVMAAWMSSPGHSANILDEDLWDIGIAVGINPDIAWDWHDRMDRGKPYYVQDFGYRSDCKYKRLFRIWAHQKNAFVGLQKDIIDQINAARADVASPALIENMALWRAAQDTAEFGDGGMTLNERLSAAGYDMWVDKDYVTISSHEQIFAGPIESSAAVMASLDADFLTTDYIEVSVGYYEGAVVVIAGKVGSRWPGLAPVCTTGMDLYHFTNSDPVSSTHTWVDTSPDPIDVESFRMPRVYAI